MAVDSEYVYYSFIILPFVYCLFRTPLVICGTKADLRNPQSNYDGPFVKFADAKKLARSYGAAGPIECSALANHRLNDLFNLAIKKAISDRQQTVSTCVVL